jgi:hypothetical protein
MRYPHFFRVDNKNILGGNPTTIKCVVIIAHSDWTYQDVWWVQQEEAFKDCPLEEEDYEKDLLKGQTLVPDIDVEETRHEFDAEEDAWLFIRDWWKNNPEIIK